MLSLDMEDPAINIWVKNRITHLFYPFTARDLGADNRAQTYFDHLAHDYYLLVHYSTIMPCYIYQPECDAKAYYAMLEGSRTDIDDFINRLKQEHKNNSFFLTLVLSVDRTYSGTLLELSNMDIVRYQKVLPMYLNSPIFALFQHQATGNVWGILPTQHNVKMIRESLEGIVNPDAVRAYKIRYDLFHV